MYIFVMSREEIKHENEKLPMATLNDKHRIFDVKWK